MDWEKFSIQEAKKGTLWLYEGITLEHENLLRGILGWPPLVSQQSFKNKKAPPS